MPLTPGYGETLVTDDEADALLPQARELLGEPIIKADVYDLEQSVQEEVDEELVTVVLDGNGRTTRLLADLVFIAARDEETPLRYSWDLDKHQCITLFQAVDRHRHPRPLAAFIEVRALGE
jgi:hypothetical protein